MNELLLRADRKCIVTVDGIDTLLEVGDVMYIKSDSTHFVTYLD